ncbi:hypothetical protein AN964_10760 [Heyndrickxia shackletonii]|uniref:Uncharacterized protein n=1 Tax=Heyndrickxia shackletonii TaxID=157838 RepID=A0A0Q3TN84_9BACI|nr:DUF6220 domain-containing protein [Heyndrickxia shackletonii]KQL55464.1 hypothetical protein AN964_10760 [Heyndrickxia shackletonii]MBB2478905.1 hypothetical protein [Bacillus sp. APMAM]NEY97788.1 hypothetical protein [Heyndrickxia shackletonii]
MSNLSLNRGKPDVGDHSKEKTNLSRLVVGARIAFKAMVRIFAICILIQVFLAGLALFWDSSQWVSHTVFARLLIIVSILILLISFIARLPHSIRLRSAGLIGIIILMAVSAKLPSGIGYISALHPVLALMLFFGTMSLTRKTNEKIKVKKQESKEQDV